MVGGSSAGLVPPPCIFDTTVLSSFALVDRLDLLEAIHGGAARWTNAVYSEVADGIGNEPQLGAVLAQEWLGVPDPCHAIEEAERIRLALGGTRNDLRHLGEATSIVLAEREGYVFASDDQDATRVARAHGVATISTVGILRECVSAEALTPTEARDLLHELIDRFDRRLPRLEADDLE
jgi:predicted nucleic acid-binding protein